MTEYSLCFSNKGGFTNLPTGYHLKLTTKFLSVGIYDIIVIDEHMCKVDLLICHVIRVIN